MKAGRISLLVASMALAGAARADIYEWEWVDAGDPSQGKQESTTLCPHGFGHDAEAHADLDHLDLTQAYLIAADLRYASFLESVLTNADLTGANLTDASFYRATLTDANLAAAERGPGRSPEAAGGPINRNRLGQNHAPLDEKGFCGPWQHSLAAC